MSGDDTGKRGPHGRIKGLHSAPLTEDFFRQLQGIRKACGVVKILTDRAVLEREAAYTGDDVARQFFVDLRVAASCFQEWATDLDAIAAEVLGEPAGVPSFASRGGASPSRPWRV